MLWFHLPLDSCIQTGLMMLGARPCTTFSLCCWLRVDGCCATTWCFTGWQYKSANPGSFLGVGCGPRVLGVRGWALFLAVPAVRKLQCQYNPCRQSFSEVSEFQVRNTYTRAVAPLPRALCRLMRQRSPGLWLGFVCSFPTFLQAILLLGVLCI